MAKKNIKKQLKNINIYNKKQKEKVLYDKNKSKFEKRTIFSEFSLDNISIFNLLIIILSIIVPGFISFALTFNIVLSSCAGCGTSNSMSSIV